MTAGWRPFVTVPNSVTLWIDARKVKIIFVVPFQGYFHLAWVAAGGDYSAIFSEWQYKNLLVQ
jgi:hypothetical protein